VIKKQIKRLCIDFRANFMKKELKISLIENNNKNTKFVSGKSFRGHLSLLEHSQLDRLHVGQHRHSPHQHHPSTTSFLEQQIGGHLVRAEVR
jgi:hypothetical protein